MRRTDYYPAWLDRLADDVILEGSVMNGSVRGPEAVRAILGHARTLYEYQDFSFAGEFGRTASSRTTRPGCRVSPSAPSS
jgi:hypothetical protein